MSALDREKPPSLIATTIKGVVVMACLFWAAGYWLSSTTDRGGLAQVVARVSRGQEPLTTGSIASRADMTRIDPCVAPKR